MFCYVFDQIASYSVMVGKITIDYISYVRDIEWTNRVDEYRRIPKGLRKTVLWMSLSKTCENHGGLSRRLSNHLTIHTFLEAFYVQVSVGHWTCDVCSDWPP